MRLTYLGMAAMVATGCGDTAAVGDSFQDDDPPAGPVVDSFQDDDLPMGDCDATDGICPSTDGVGDGGANIGEPCDGGVQCQSGVCAATFANAEPGPLSCQLACIEVMDTAMWCTDSATCCGDAVCTARGLCVLDEGSGGESSDAFADEPARGSSVAANGGSTSTSGSTDAGESTDR